MNAMNDFSEYKVYHKTYPQRHNRAKLNYRDLERGIYERLYQPMYSIHGSTLLNKHNTRSRNEHDGDNDGVQEVIDLSMDDDDEKSTDNTEHFRRHLWCVCRKPWDHSRVMLRCDSCANWYHGDCIGVSKEQAKLLEANADQFICPPCRGISHSNTKPTRSSDESILMKRKHSNGLSSANNHKTKENGILSKMISLDGSAKRLKEDISTQQDSSRRPSVECIVRGCKNQPKLGWVYCSVACIRRHINERLQAIQQSKGVANEDIPAREDILLYESKSKKILEKNLVPQIEDLSTWINQNPTYEILPSSSRQSLILTRNRSKDLTQSQSSTAHTNKSKISSVATVHNQSSTSKPIPNKKKLTQVTKQTNNTTSSIYNNTTDIRSKVPTALYDKIIMRLEKNGETPPITEDIRTIVNQIEQEMFRVYNKVDNSYKNKFRSLLANISNMNNNYFYKQILSKQLTAKDIVAMKAEDMLPPEEKEKRKDQFEKEVQMIINAEQQLAEELARHTQIKLTRQGYVDNVALLPVLELKGPSSLGDKHSANTSNSNTEITQSTNPSTDKTSEAIISTARSYETSRKLGSNGHISSAILRKNLPGIPSAKPTDSNKSSKPLPLSSNSKQANSVCSEADSDNDYIEPESPTGIDASIYDDDDDLNNMNNSSQSSTIHSPTDNSEHNTPHQQIIRDDYNPSRIRNETSSLYQPTAIVRLPNQWSGVIHPSDIKIPCQSVHIYGECNHLIEHIPKQLIILGRLRLADLWEYIHESLAVRDVLILTLSSSSLNTNDNEVFLQYFDTIQSSKRAAVISKCTNTSHIRDMYILAADTKDCPSNVLSSLFLPVTFERKQFFLVLIGSGKRSTKSISRSNENQSLNTLIYKPIALQDSTTTRDPRLLRNKDPRLNKSSTASENIVLSTLQPINTEPVSVQYSNDDLLKLMSDSLEHIRQSSTIDHIQSIIMSTMEILRRNNRYDLCTRFTDNHRIAMAQWHVMQGNTSVPTTTIAGDNLIEENMDVDDDQEDKRKKQFTTSSTSNSKSDDFNDIDYRFLEQDMADHLPTSTFGNDQQKPRRKSRFSDLLPTHTTNRFAKSKAITPVGKLFSPAEKDKSLKINRDLPLDHIQIASTKSIDKHISTSLGNKFHSPTNSTESSINTKEKSISKPICFSFAKDSLRRNRTNMSVTQTNQTDTYQCSSKSDKDLMKPSRSYNYHHLSSTMINTSMQQQKTKNKFCSSTNDWKWNDYNSRTSEYHDLDQPQE